MKEILAPASSLEKIKIAYSYGADAIYIGMSNFSLRKRASKIDEESITEALEYAKKLNKKIYITANIIPRDSDIKDVKKFFKMLSKLKVDGVIIASPYFMKVASKCKNLNISVSTQESTANSYALKYWEEKKAKRAVLARELSIDDIKNIKSNIELEVFIHGGVCMSYSGRCVLSNLLTKRDANRGDCAHSCRWIYKLYDKDKKVSDKEFSISSKDLETTKIFEQLENVDNIKSYKIEGRMKSENYLATITSIYSHIQSKLKNKEKIDYDMLKKEMLTAGGRDYSTFNINDIRTSDTQIYNYNVKSPNQTFIGVVTSYNKLTNEVEVRQRNRFFLNDKVYFFSQNGRSKTFNIKELKNEKGELIETARHPEEIVKFKVDFDVKIGDLLKKENE